MKLEKMHAVFFFLFALSAVSKPVYFVHMHKSGGTRLCSIAKSMAYGISGSKNCGPTVKLISTDRKAIHTLKEYVSNAVENEEEMKVVMCRNRSPPDKCNPWLRVNTFDRARIWPLKGRSFELEIPLWLYERKDEHERILKESKATFIANERYVSSVVHKNLRNHSQRETCYVTMLRDPLDRTMSHWKHDRGSRIDLPPSVTLDEYLQKYHRDNLMTRTLCGSPCINKEKLDVKDYEEAARTLRLMDVVLITEEYAKGLEVLQKVCGSPSPSKKWTDYIAEAEQHFSSTHAREELNGKQKRAFHNKNRWDLALYKEAKKLFLREEEEEKEKEPEIEEDVVSEEVEVLEEPLAVSLETQYVTEYRDLGPWFTSAVHADNPLRIKFPSLFRTSVGGYRILFNLRNDHICEGYLVTARVDLRDDVSVLPYEVNGEDQFVYPTEERRELFNGKRGLSTIPFPFPRKGTSRGPFTFTGPEDPRSINSPDGSMVYLVFNCRIAQGGRKMVVIDYNRDPSRGVFLGIRGHEMRGTEKNWSPFFVSKKHYEKRGRETKDEWVLHFIYSIGPTFILACPDVPNALKSGKQTVDCDLLDDTTTKKTFSRLDHFARQVLVRGSSNFIEYRWPYYVGLTHTRIPVLEGCKKGFCKPCYRSQLMVMDMDRMQPIHLSESLTFPPEFIRGLNRGNAEDSYNHYTTGLYLDDTTDRWYIGLDIDDQHPTLGILLHHYKGNEIHELVRSMGSTRACPKSRMSTLPGWARSQGRCRSKAKPKLPW
jgi:hypothetical protein